MFVLFVCFFAVIKNSGCTVTKSTSEETFKQCLVSQPSASLGYCLGVGAISKLQTWDNDPQFDVIDGVTFSRDDQQYREAYNFIDRDPSDFR